MNKFQPCNGINGCLTLVLTFFCFNRPLLSHLGTLLSQTERGRGHQRTKPRVERRRRERRRRAKGRMQRGRSLKPRRRSSPRMTPPQALMMKRQVSSALKYLHIVFVTEGLNFDFCSSQKNKGRKKQQNSDMDKDARRRKADELRE